MSIITVGIDLAKNIFAVHGVNEAGKPELVKPKVTRDQLLPLVANLPPCLIGMEACTGAHHWARLFRQHGHTVRLIAPKFVTPYRMSGKRGKNDAADAAAICEAVTRPQMRFVPIKDEHQQATLTLHRTRQVFVEERTALYNRIRGLIAEFGIVLPQKVERLRHEIGAHLEDLPGWANRCVGDMLSHADRLDERIREYDHAIAEIAREDARCRRLMQLPGIGPTSATALVSSIG
jgi:transposase